MENTVLQQRRPLGITIIAIVLVVMGILGIIIGIFTLVESFYMIYRPAIGMRFGFIGMTSVLLGAVDLFVAWGLWKLKRWAFWATLVIAILDILQAAWSLFNGESFWYALFSVALPIIVLIYLLVDQRVRAAFNV